VFSIAVFRPAWPDRAGDSPNWLATMLWTRAPAFDNPLPEVFAERSLGHDGFASLPVATALCEKVLTFGDGQDVWWPVPCAPKPAPAECVRSGALCYVNDGVYSPAPKQAGFVFSPSPERSWTSKGDRRFDHVLARLGKGIRISRLSDEGGRFAGGTELEQLFLVEGSSGGAAWVRVMSRPIEQPDVVLDLMIASRVEILDANLGTVKGPVALPPGKHDLALPAASPILILVTDER
jgi:hypothetical protein